MDANPSRFILAAFCAAAFSLAPANAKLAAWFPLDDFSSNSDFINDNISNIEALLINFDPDTPAESPITRIASSARPNLGAAYDFDAIGGIDLGTSSEVQPSNQFTISFWFQPQTQNPFARLFESLVGNDMNQSGIRIDLNSAGNTVRTLIRDGSGEQQIVSHPTILKNDGTWYFFALRYDSTLVDTSPMQITLIESGDSLLDETAIANDTTGPATIITGPLAPYASASFVGVATASGPAGTGLDAKMDEIAFFNNSDNAGFLSNAQLAATYNFGPSGVELISSFESDISSIPSGGSATLSWTVTEPFDSLVITDSLGTETDVASSTTNGSGSTTVSPSDSTSYFLKSTRGDAENVSAISVLAASPPLVDTFTTSAKVSLSSAPVTLNWSVTGANSLTITPGSITVTGETSTIVNPTETTTYTLTATNNNGSTTSEQTITIIEAPLPANRYLASTSTNSNTAWQDEIGTSTWTLNGSTVNNPSLTTSPSTNITAAYSTDAGVFGGGAGSFRYPEFSAEIWLALNQLTPDYNVVFETGGGFAGLSCIVNQSELRFLGSFNNARTLDVPIPISGLLLSDFVQVVFSYSTETDTFNASIRDTAAQVRTVSATDVEILIGGNGAGLFAFRGGDNSNPNALGGHTEGVETPIPGLMNFRSEIAIVNVYDRVLSEADVITAFNRVSTGTVNPPADDSFDITAVTLDAEANTLSLTWQSVSGNTYDAQFLDTDTNEWNNLGETAVAVATTTTKAFPTPGPNASRYFLRIIDLGVIAQ